MLNLKSANKRNAHFLFMLPWALSFLLFFIGPIIASLVLSFTSFDGLNSPLFIGFENYRTMLFEDPMFYNSLRVTLSYALIALPLGTVFAIMTAILLNQKIIGQSFYRTLIYLPTIIPIVASSVVWNWVFKADETGLINNLLAPIYGALGINAPLWLADKNTALPALIIMSFWSLGNPIVIYLAGLQNIPESLYEAAELDGAGSATKLWHITLPMLSPTIFFNVSIGIIQVFQYFVPAYVMTSGGPEGATMFYSLYAYQAAFDDFRMGYASALAWVLFVIVLAASYFSFRVSRSLVHYN